MGDWHLFATILLDSVTEKFDLQQHNRPNYHDCVKKGSEMEMYTLVSRTLEASTTFIEVYLLI